MALGAHPGEPGPFDATLPYRQRKRRLDEQTDRCEYHRRLGSASTVSEETADEVAGTLHHPSAVVVTDLQWCAFLDAWYPLPEEGRHRGTRMHGLPTTRYGWLLREQDIQADL